MAWNTSKYHNKKTVIDGITFDSKREGARYKELKVLERVGAISNLEMQVKYVLIPTQREPDYYNTKGKKVKGKLIERECSYFADFRYFDRESGEIVVEDVKGVKTPVYNIKKKLMLHVHGVRIVEI